MFPVPSAQCSNACKGFRRSLLISIEDEEEQGGGKTEAETYAEYCAYVEEWAEYANDGGQDQGTSPLTYEEWKEENAERVEAE